MTTYLTIWHYIALILITLLFITATLSTLRQEDLKGKASIVIIYFFTAIGLVFASILMIDTYTKKVVLVDVDNHRFLPTEEIIFTGTVRNGGNYTIGEVSVEIKIINRDTVAKEGDPSFQSNAFAELLGDDPKTYKPSYLMVTEVVATDLGPGERKQFRIAMPHPPYFKGYSDYVRAFGH